MKELLQNETVFKIKNASAILIPFVFASYNLIIGVVFKTDWNLTIAWYYLMLLLVRLFIVVCDRKAKGNYNAEKTVYIVSFIFLLLLDIALIGPSILLVNNKKAVHATEISANAMATYAFFNVVVAVINLKKKEKSLIKKQLKLVAFVNALASIMVLENTLINVNGSLEGGMYILSFVTTFLFVIVLFFLAISFL